MKAQSSSAASEATLTFIGSYFLEAARQLREILDVCPEEFEATAKAMKIGRRKAYVLAQIDRSFHALGIDRERLRKIGWTKLAMLSPYVSPDNVEELLALASDMPSHSLRLVLRGEDVDPDARVVPLLLRPDEMAVFNEAMHKFGGIKHPHGWVKKEEAIVAALRFALNE